MSYLSINRLLSLLISILAATTLASQIQFYDKETTFAVALETLLLDNGTQILMQISAPTTYAWTALGSGTMMADSIMFVLYPSSNNSEVTLSIRTVNDNRHNPPHEIESNKVHARVRSSSIKDGRMTADIVWQEPSDILCGVVDPRSHNQPFIWAVGPVTSSNAGHDGPDHRRDGSDDDDGPHPPIKSDDTDVPITKHDEHGVIFANMVASQNPLDDFHSPQIQGTSSNGMQLQPEYYHTLVFVHAAILAASFVLIFPLGVILLRLNPRKLGFKMHWMIQCFALVAVICGLGVAITMSILGVRYKYFVEPHQIVGISVCVLAGFQAYLGRAHHIRFKVYQRRKAVSYIHMVVGRLVIYGGMTNVVLGLLLCQRGPAVYIAAGVALAVLVVQEFFAIRAHLKRRHDDSRTERIKGYNSNYQKLKDVSVTEQELNTTFEMPMQRYQSHGYAQQR